MGRPRKLETLTTTISGRIRPTQEMWLRFHAERRFDGELSRTLRWALDQAEAFTAILNEDDPVYALDRMLNPEKFDMPDPEEEIVEAERELAEWKREQAIKRAKRRKTAE